jgi:hypothetical protein
VIVTVFFGICIDVRFQEIFMAATAHSRNNSLTCFVFVLFSLLALYMWSSRLGIDGYELEFFLSADNLVRNGSLSMVHEPPDIPGVPDRHSDRYQLPRHNLFQVFLTVPFYVAGMPFNHLFRPAETGLLALPLGSLVAVSLLNPLLTVLCVILLYLIVRTLDYKESTCRFITVLYGVATMAWPYAVIGMEPLQTAMMLLSFLCFLNLARNINFKNSCILAVSLTALMHTKVSAPIVAFPTALAGFILLLHRRKQHKSGLFLYTVVLVLSGAIWFLLYQTRKQGIYSPGFFANFNLALIPRNIIGMLFSPGKSLFVYNPILVFTLAGIPVFFRKHRCFSLILWMTATATLILTACWDWALVEESWGPRYLMPLVPILMISGISNFDLTDRKRGFVILFAVLTMVSVLIQFPGVVYSNASLMRSVQNQDIAIVDLTVWTPDLSPVPVGWHLISNNVRSAFGYSSKPWRWLYYKGLVGQGAKPNIVAFETNHWNRPCPAIFLIARYLQRTVSSVHLEYPDSPVVFPIWMLVTAGILASIILAGKRWIQS